MPTPLVNDIAVTQHADDSLFYRELIGEVIQGSIFLFGQLGINETAGGVATRVIEMDQKVRSHPVSLDQLYQVRQSQFHSFLSIPRWITTSYEEVHEAIPISAGVGGLGAATRDNLKMRIAKGIANRFGRAFNTKFLAGLIGNAYTSIGFNSAAAADGSNIDIANPITLPASRIIAANSTGLTVAKMKEGKAALAKLYEFSNANRNPLVFAVMSQRQFDDLIADPDLNLMSIQPYTGIKVIDNQEPLVRMVSASLGVNIIITGATQGTFDGTNGTRHVTMWTPDGVVWGMNPLADMFVETAPSGSLTAASTIYALMSFACARIDEERVVQIDCLDNPTGSYAGVTVTGTQPDYDDSTTALQTFTNAPTFATGVA